MLENNIYNYKIWILETDPSILKPFFEGLLNDCGYTILNFIEHYFEPQGYTCLWLLAESHFAIHTFPESSKTYIELTGCRKEHNEMFKSRLVESEIQLL